MLVNPIHLKQFFKQKQEIVCLLLYWIKILKAGLASVVLVNINSTTINAGLSITPTRLQDKGQTVVEVLYPVF